jgi:hypothetical protein
MLHQDYEANAFRSNAQSEMCRWDSQVTYNQQCLFESGNQNSEYQQTFNDNSHQSTGFVYPQLERKDSVIYPSHQPIRSSDSTSHYTYSGLERKDTMHFGAGNVKAADQVVFTEFELPSGADYGIDASNQNLLGMRTTSLERRTSGSNNWPVSLPEASSHFEQCSNGFNAHSQTQTSDDKSYHSDCSCSSSSRSTQFASKEDALAVEAASPEDGSFRMTRVDWRWAAMKGFWDKDKKCWIESAGGQAAYIQQRMKRVKVRQQRLARQAKALQRLVPVQNLPFRSGLVEELPYRLDNDPWTEGLGVDHGKKRSGHSAKSTVPTWFDSKTEPTVRGTSAVTPPVSVQVFPFARTVGSDLAAPVANLSSQWTKQEHAAPAMQWFEKAYANSNSLPVQQNTWNSAEDTSVNFRSNGASNWPLTESVPQMRAVSWW